VDLQLDGQKSLQRLVEAFVAQPIFWRLWGLEKTSAEPLGSLLEAK
jgi:hypothetical protein